MSFEVNIKHPDRPLTPATHGGPNEKGETQASPLLTSPAYVAVYHSSDDIMGAPTAGRRMNRSRRVCVRLVHFFLLGCLFWYFAPTILDHFPLWRGIMSGDHSHGEPGQCLEHATWTNDNLGRPLPRRPHYEYVAHSSLSLPRHSNLLYFFSQGVLANGAIQFVDDGESGNGDVTVDITAFYNYEDLLGRIDVCRVKRGENDNGIGILTPNYHPHPRRDDVHFDVVVRLPSSEGIAEYTDLETRLSIFAHTIDDLQHKFAFQNVNFATSNTPIQVKSILAKQLVAQTSNGPIGGTFNITDRLDIHTSNSPITADVYAYNDGRSDLLVTSISLTTSNSPIKTNLFLHSRTANETGGSFDVKLRTSNSPLDVFIPEAPLNHTLKLNAVSSNGQIRAGIHKAFEGNFGARSSTWFTPNVFFSSTQEEDPSGQNRERKTSLTKGRGYVRGWVSWGNPSFATDSHSSSNRPYPPSRSSAIYGPPSLFSAIPSASQLYSAMNSAAPSSFPFMPSQVNPSSAQPSGAASGLRGDIELVTSNAGITLAL
ncbi:hypothetical protein C8Q75DRAFT_772828 [Abortiporus biennis]|nr:hypothetical protein C8Q75DRAFT_772828 [Abortiporus biennis]